MSVIWLALLHYYTLFSGFLAYVLISITKIKITNTDILFLFGFSLLIISQIALKEPLAVVIHSRFFWGWIIFYFIFKANIVSLSMLNTTLVFLSILTLIEAVLINTIIDARSLPNYPEYSKAASHFVALGFYQRPYSFGGNATVGSSLLVTLIVLCNIKGWRLWLAILAVLSFVSGTGAIALMIVLLIKHRSFILKSMFPVLLLTLLANYVFRETVTSIYNRFAYKLGPDYIQHLLKQKYALFTENINDMEFYMLIIGNPQTGIEGYGGDFGLLSFIIINGFLGLSLVLFIVLSRLNKYNKLPLFILLLTSLHYPVMFYLPGQMIFGLLLSINKNSLRYILNKTNRLSSQQVYS